jgi:hypothetical protein
MAGLPSRARLSLDVCHPFGRHYAAHFNLRQRELTVAHTLPTAEPTEWSLWRWAFQGVFLVLSFTGHATMSMDGGIRRHGVEADSHV